MYNIKIKYTQTEENIMLDIKIEKVKTPKVKPDYSALGFGKYFTDHMFLMNYSEDKGWHDARIVPYGPIPLDPSTMVFHYAQELFEGLKADTEYLFEARTASTRERFASLSAKVVLTTAQPPFLKR